MRRYLHPFYDRFHLMLRTITTEYIVISMMIIANSSLGLDDKLYAVKYFPSSVIAGSHFDVLYTNTPMNLCISHKSKFNTIVGKILGRFELLNNLTLFVVAEFSIFNIEISVPIVFLLILFINN